MRAVIQISSYDQQKIKDLIRTLEASLKQLFQGDISIVVKNETDRR